MPSIKVLPHKDICPNGMDFAAASGKSICHNLLHRGIRIEHACEMSSACSTCHVIVREGFDSLVPSDDVEDDLLDLAWGLTPFSRLACQAIVEDGDLVLEIPRYTLNHAKESS